MGFPDKFLNSRDFPGFCTLAQATAACRQPSSHAEHDRINIARTQSFSEFWDDEIVRLICPTCQAFGPNRRLQRPPATLHGVVFDIFGGSRSDPARRHCPESARWLFILPSSSIASCMGRGSHPKYAERGIAVIALQGRKPPPQQRLWEESCVTRAVRDMAWPTRNS